MKSRASEYRISPNFIVRLIICSLEAPAQGAMSWRYLQNMNHIFSECPKLLEHEKGLR